MADPIIKFSHTYLVTRAANMKIIHVTYAVISDTERDATARNE